MNKKTIISFIFLLVVILTFILVSQESKPIYSDNEQDWISSASATSKTILVSQVTKGQAVSLNDAIEFFIDNSTSRVVRNSGYYKGISFTNSYPLTDNPAIKFSTTMNPKDGIIEVFVVEKIKDDKLVVNIFVDEDWKKQLPNTNVIWGSKYQFAEPFNFKNIQSGIYMMEIEDDPSRFSFNYQESVSGIIVGEITQDEVLNGITEEKTLIIFQ